jgi:hypothetical protein
MLKFLAGITFGLIGETIEVGDKLYLDDDHSGDYITILYIKGKDAYCRFSFDHTENNRFVVKKPLRLLRFVYHK